MLVVFYIYQAHRDVLAVFYERGALRRGSLTSRVYAGRRIVRVNQGYYAKHSSDFFTRLVSGVLLSPEGRACWLEPGAISGSILHAP